MKPKDLAQLNASEVKQFLNSFDHVFCDCDGVLMKDHNVLPKVNETLNSLQVLGKTIAFVTNNTCLSTEEIVDKLQEANFLNINLKCVLTPALAIASYLKQINFDKKLYVIGLPGLRRDLQQFEYEIVNSHIETLEIYKIEELHREFNKFDKTIGAVIVALDFNMTILSLNRAINYLHDNNIQFIITSDEKTMPWRGSTHICLGPGHIQEIVRHLTGRKPLGFGKPLTEFADFIRFYMKQNNYDSERVLFIGDSLEQDISFAKLLGNKQLLVLTGTTNLTDLEQIDEDKLPDYYLENLSQLTNLIKNATDPI